VGAVIILKRFTELGCGGIDLTNFSEEIDLLWTLVIMVTNLGVS
jgi:hypothetical protein